MALLSVFEHPHHCDKLMRYSHALGIDHVETARHYMESEAQLRPLLKKYRDEGQSWLVQTKIRPYAVDKIADKAGGGALYKAAFQNCTHVKNGVCAGDTVDPCPPCFTRRP